MSRTTGQSSSIASVLGSDIASRNDAHVADRTARYVDLYYRQYRPRTKIKPEARLQRLVAPPVWYGRVKARIDSSIAGQAKMDDDNSFATIGPTVASAANNFFHECGAYLPSEPYIYPS